MNDFSHLKNKLLAEQIEDQIYHYILDTPIEPGAKLPNEFELGEKFGVGRSTIREAVKLLSSKGIVEVRRGSGTYGDSHPGSAHLDQFVKEAVQAVNDNGGKAARYFATDMCDGIAQGHDGINYSLPHRDAIVNLVEAQADAIFRAASVLIDDFRCDND